MSPVETRAGTNIGGAAEHNRRVVMHALRVNGPMSRADIARATQLVPQTVSNIIELLEAEHLVRGATPVRRGRGQPAIPYSIAPDGAHAFGIQIDHHRVRVVAVDLVGTVLTRAECPLAGDGLEADMDGVMSTYAAAAATLAQVNGGPSKRIAGIGLGMPAPTGYHAKPADPWMAVATTGAHPLVAELVRRTGLPVSLHHDASAAAVAERLSGAANGVDDFVYVFVGSGLGAGLFVRGELHLGADRLAGEVGLLPFRSDNDGTTLEAVASLGPLYHRLGVMPNAPDLYDALQRGYDAGLADDWLGRAAEALAWLFQVIDCVLNPAVIILGGQMPDDLMTALFDRASDAANDRRSPDGLVCARLRRGSAQPFNVATGAAAYQIAAAYDPSLSAIVKISSA